MKKRLYEEFGFNGSNCNHIVEPNEITKHSKPIVFWNIIPEKCFPENFEYKDILWIDTLQNRANIEREFGIKINV